MTGAKGKQGNAKPSGREGVQHEGRHGGAGAQLTGKFGATCAPRSASEGI
jgi:hypothetical protein